MGAAPPAFHPRPVLSSMATPIESSIYGDRKSSLRDKVCFVNYTTADLHLL
jgi:hypothetical protein